MAISLSYHGRSSSAMLRKRIFPGWVCLPRPKRMSFSVGSVGSTLSIIRRGTILPRPMLLDLEPIVNCKTCFWRELSGRLDASTTAARRERNRSTTSANNHKITIRLSYDSSLPTQQCASLFPSPIALFNLPLLCDDAPSSLPRRPQPVHTKPPRPLCTSNPVLLSRSAIVVDRTHILILSFAGGMLELWGGTRRIIAPPIPNYRRNIKWSMKCVVNLPTRN